MSNAHKPTIKAVFFDIDGTLYRKEAQYLPASLAPALKALKAAGVLVGIATGRSACALPEAVVDLIKEVGIEALITTNGQCVQYQGRTLFIESIDKQAIEKMLPVVRAQGLHYGLVSNERIATSSDHECVQKALRYIADFAVEPDYYLEHDVQQILLFAEDEFKASLMDLPEFAGFKLIAWRHNAVDLLPKEASKIRGITVLLEQLGLSAEEIMTFGDGFNDLEMIEFSGVGVAMADGQPELLAVADVVAPTLEEDGIAKVLIEQGLID